MVMISFLENRISFCLSKKWVPAIHSNRCVCGYIKISVLRHSEVGLVYRVNKHLNKLVLVRNASQHINWKLTWLKKLLWKTQTRMGTEYLNSPFYLLLHLMRHDVVVWRLMDENEVKYFLTKRPLKGLTWLQFWVLVNRLVKQKSTCRNRVNLYHQILWCVVNVFMTEKKRHWKGFPIYATSKLPVWLTGWEGIHSDYLNTLIH